MQKESINSPELSEEAIRNRAYQIYEERGCEPGYELDDWFQAEADVLGKKAPHADRKAVPPKIVAA